MTLKEINKTTIKDLNNQELLMMHYRCHLLFKKAVKNKTNELLKVVIMAHNIISKEMTERSLKHNTPLVESYIEKLFF